VSQRGVHPRTPRGADLIGQTAIKDLVREAYRRVVGTTSTIAERLYEPDQLAVLPAGAIAQALGVGNPVRAARLKPGDVVHDLGCGGGIERPPRGSARRQSHPPRGVHRRLPASRQPSVRRAGRRDRSVLFSSRRIWWQRCRPTQGAPMPRLWAPDPAPPLRGHSRLRRLRRGEVSPREPGPGEAIGDLLDTIVAEHEQIARLLRTLLEADWSRQGRHPSLGVMSIEFLARRMGEHAEEHAAQIEEATHTRG
jgi:hypothetical protein